MSDYRRGVRRCPGCQAAMAERAFRRTMVDVCQACFGIWVDWMDGPLASVGQAVGKLPLGRRERATEAPCCPDCATELDPVIFGAGETPIFRCGRCAGSFIPRGSLALLEAPPPPEAPDSLLHRVLHSLSRLLGD